MLFLSIRTKCTSMRYWYFILLFIWCRSCQNYDITQFDNSVDTSGLHYISAETQKICKCSILESLTAVNNFTMTFTRKSITDLRTDGTDKSISYLCNVPVKGINSLQLYVPFSRVLLHIHNLMHRDSYKVASNALFSHIWNLTPV